MFKELNLKDLISNGSESLLAAGVQIVPDGYDIQLSSTEVTSFIKASANAMAMLNDIEKVVITRSQLVMLLNVKSTHLTGLFLKHRVRTITQPMIEEMNIETYIKLLLNIIDDYATDNILKQRCRILAEPFLNEEFLNQHFDECLVSSILWDRNNYPLKGA